MSKLDHVRCDYVITTMRMLKRKIISSWAATKRSSTTKKQTQQQDKHIYTEHSKQANDDSNDVRQETSRSSIIQAWQESPT
jgi:hypothetical protein